MKNVKKIAEQIISFAKKAEVGDEYVNEVENFKDLYDFHAFKKRIKYDPNQYPKEGKFRITIREKYTELYTKLKNDLNDYIREAKYPLDFDTLIYGNTKKIRSDKRFVKLFQTIPGSEYEVIDNFVKTEDFHDKLNDAKSEMNKKLIHTFTPIFKELINFIEKSGGNPTRVEISLDRLTFSVAKYFIAIDWSGYSQSQGNGYTFAIVPIEKKPYTYKSRALYSNDFMDTSSLISKVKEFMKDPKEFVKDFDVAEIKQKVKKVDYSVIYHEMIKHIGDEQLQDFISIGIKNKKKLIDNLIENAYDQTSQKGLTPEDQKKLKIEITKYVENFMRNK
jgi:hypothetical protein